MDWPLCSCCILLLLCIYRFISFHCFMASRYHCSGRSLSKRRRTSQGHSTCGYCHSHLSLGLNSSYHESRGTHYAFLKVEIWQSLGSLLQLACG
jgi:hypothetical protein